MKSYMKNRIRGAVERMRGAFDVASRLFAEDRNWLVISGVPPTGFIASFADANTGAMLHREIIGTLQATQEPYIDQASRTNILKLADTACSLISSTQCGNGPAHYGTIRVNQMSEPVIVSVGGLAGPFDHVFACIGGIWIADDSREFQESVVPRLMGDNDYWQKLNEHETRSAIFNIAF